MTTILLTLAAALFVVGPEHSGGVVCPARLRATNRPRWEVVGLRLKGRVLGGLVKEGATREQVVCLLGPHQSPLKPLPSGGVIAGRSYSFYIWDDLGLNVEFNEDGEGVERAGPILFAPLFD